jgi:outer membrane protein assembly factor BamB
MKQRLIAIACILAMLPATAAGAAGTATEVIADPVAVNWKQSIGPFIPTTPVLGQDGSLYVTGVSALYLDGRNDSLTAWHADGSKKWTLPMQDTSVSPIIGSDGKLYVADGRLLAIDAERGTIDWEFSLPGIQLTGQPVSNDGILYVTDNDGGMLYAVDLQGHMLWDMRIAEPYNRLSPIAIDTNGNSYIVSTDIRVDDSQLGSDAPLALNSVLHAYDKDGAPLWQAKLDGMEPLKEAPFITSSHDIIVGKNRLFIVSQEGKVQWRYSLKMAFNPSDITIWNGSIYYTYYDEVHVLSLSGQEQQSFRTGGNMNGQLRINPVNGAAYGWLEKGELGAWSMTGSRRFLHKPLSKGRIVANASVIADPTGMLYTGYADVQNSGTMEGFVIAFSDRTPAKLTGNSDAAVYVDQKKLALQGKPEQFRGRMFVPMREIFTVLGATMTYDVRTKTIEAAKGDTRLTYKIGDYSAAINGRIVQLDAPGKVIDNRTLVPLRFISEAFGYAVIWDAPSSGIKIVTQGR